MRGILLGALLMTACTSHRLIDRVQAYRDAHARGDVEAEQRFLSPDARIWYEQRSGEGDALRAGNAGRYQHWDEFFHSRSKLRDWTVEGNAVSATVEETNDFYELLEWKPNPYRMTWWLDAEGRITGAMVRSMPGSKTKGRLEEFRDWARAHHPEELELLMPGGKIDPTGDRPERWKKMLAEWRVYSANSRTGGLR